MIEVMIYETFIVRKGTFENDFGVKKSYDTLEIMYFGGRRAYIRTWNNGSKVGEIRKQLQFNDDKSVTINFKKDKYKVGEWRNKPESKEV
jgi:hypothetical protein